MAAREAWRLEAIGRSCTWITARDGEGALVGLARILDDGGLHAALWDVLVRPAERGLGIGRRLVEIAVERCADRSLLVLVSTPAATGFFEHLGFRSEAHGHRAMYLRPHRSSGHNHE